ncbi:Galactose oxidase, central domain containing protein [Novymonas esmeraldas]|uniref:Galactose oxidase, central domain containing protein n=1 Tax=Novymonas esmeraldas TaxID=1808958 RepID=A0AAW0F2F7_9TRYP
MSSTAAAPAPQRGDSVQVELVDVDGHPITQHPIGVEELLRQDHHTLDLGSGIALRLEALNAEQDYSDDDDDDDDVSSTDGRVDDEDAAEFGAYRADRQGDGATSAAVPAPAVAAPPPGTRAAGDWYDVLGALRREQAEVERISAEVETARRRPGDGEGRLVTRHHKEGRTATTPLKRFSDVPGADGKSIAADADSKSAAPPGASRREVWASLAPAADSRPHNYQVLRYVSYMPALDYRRFRPTALAFHAAASYLNRNDRGLRLLVYGGVSVGARCVEQELYEFSVLTGNWRRLEGRQLVPAGHYGHTMTVVEPLDRLIVVGGIGPGGAAVSRETRQEWSTDPLRAPRYECLCPLVQRRAGKAAATTAATLRRTCGEGVAQLPPGAASAPAAAIGFVSLLFDMNLTDQTWRAIEPAAPFPLAFHTAVHFGKELFVFGGLTAELRVTGQLLAIHSETYAVRLVHSDDGAVRRSRRAEAGGRGDGDGDDNDNDNVSEAVAEVGPGPRFLHTAVRYGPFMIVYGGYDAHNEVCSDCWAFDMANERWERLRCRGAAPGRAAHECCVVGCRMLVTGGFESSLEDARGGGTPAATAMELNLVPTVGGEHVWRAEVRLHPPLPPLAFTRCVPCGDEHSFLLFGGLTKAVRRAGRSRSAGKRAASATRRAAPLDDEDKSDAEADEAAHGGAEDGRSPAPRGAAEPRGLWGRLTPFDDGLVLTFPEKRQRARRAGGEPVVNALGVEVDPAELPEHFQAFVRRQADFIKKKDAAAADTVRKVTLEEQEGMEPALYLTDAEIELLLHRSEECCLAFAERYKMDTLPSNVPDREERVHLVEECISESRQVRDVVRSMKGSAPGVTAVKSKTHRKRAGQKFEDYSAAKPFRRVVVMHLLDGINRHLARMHRLNKALRTVDWPEKGEFLAAVSDMQHAVHAVSRAIAGVLNKYIQGRVESLMKGTERHKEVMRLLTQVVEKNRHDKVWGVESAREEKRRAAAAGQQREAKRGASQRRASPPASAARGRAARSRSLGGGYHADESKAVVFLPEKEWQDMLRRAGGVERCADQLRRYCEAGVGSGGGGDAASTAAPLPPPLAVSNAPPPSQPPAPSAPLLTPFVVAPPVAAADAPAADVAGAARPRDIVVRHSNEVRRATAAAAEEVRRAAADLRRTLTDAAASPPSSRSPSSSDTTPAGSGAPAPVPPAAAAATAPAPQLLPTPAVTTAQAPAALPDPHGNQRSSTYSSSSHTSRSSSSSTSSSAPHAPAAAAAAPGPSLLLAHPTPPVSSAAAALPPPSTGFLPAPPPPPPLLPAAAAAPTQSTGKSDGAPEAVKTADAPAQALVERGHALHLSALRPLLVAKEALLRLKEKVGLVRVNDWAGDDLAGAPQDGKVEELHTRLVTLLTAVAQSITASFLSKAGARPPRARSVATALRPPPPAPAHTRPPRGAGGAGSRVVAIDRAAAAPKSLPASGAGEGRCSSSSRKGANGAAAAATGAAEVEAAESRRLRPLPRDHGEDGGDWLHAALARPIDGGAGGVPLVSHEALVRDVLLADAAPAPRAPSAGDAVSTGAAAVEVRSVYPTTRTVPNTDAAAVALYSAVAAPLSTGPWAPAPPLSYKSGPGADAMPLVTLGVVPRVLGLSSSPNLSIKEPGAATSTSQAPHQRQRSTIMDLTQLRHPSQRRGSAGASISGGSASTADCGDPVTRAPVTSITGGNFVVNAEYLTRAAPEVVPPPATAEERRDGGVGGAQNAWADVDDDYFYFGRPVEKRMAPAAGETSGPPYIVPRPGAGGVGVSPPVGTVVGSPRVTAELAVPPMRSACGPAPASAPPRTGSATARRSTSGRRASDHYLSATASQTLKASTARPAVVRKDGAKHSFYTPGELQLMQARERLRSRPSK